MSGFDVLEQKVQAQCDALAEFPEKRLAIRERFYRQYPCKSKAKDATVTDFAQFEQQFFSLQAERGVFNALDATVPGSPWWRGVNLKLIYFAELALAILSQADEFSNLPVAVKKWLKYLKKPNAKNWFRAFNSSVICAANLCRVEAAQESEQEQQYINVILYRLMFAQAMEEQADIFTSGDEAGQVPWSFNVGNITHMPSVQAESYPLEDAAVDDALSVVGDIQDPEQMAFAAEVEAKLDSLGNAVYGIGEDRLLEESMPLDVVNSLDEQTQLLDNRYIHPHMQRLFDKVAKWDSVPFVAEWCQNGRAVYPAI